MKELLSSSLNVALLVEVALLVDPLVFATSLVQTLLLVDFGAGQGRSSVSRIVETEGRSKSDFLATFKSLCGKRRSPLLSLLSPINDFFFLGVKLPSASTTLGEA